jgi:hypothetical protein
MEKSSSKNGLALLISYDEHFSLPVTTTQTASHCLGCPIVSKSKIIKGLGVSREVKAMLEAEGFEVLTLASFLGCDAKKAWPRLDLKETELQSISIAVLDMSAWNPDIACLIQKIIETTIPHIFVSNPEEELPPKVKDQIDRFLNKGNYFPIGNGVCLSCTLDMFQRSLSSMKIFSISHLKGFNNQSLKQLSIYLDYLLKTNE